MKYADLLDCYKTGVSCFKVNFETFVRICFLLWIFSVKVHDKIKTVNAFCS